MKIVPNYTVLNNQSVKRSVSFAQNPADDKREVKEIPHFTADYNVSKPMSYTKIEDIKLPDNLTAHYYKLGNGQKIVIVPKKGNTVVKSYVNTGALNEPDRVRGISHYIEHNLFNGSEALGDKDFFEEVHKMGAYTNASTNLSITDYVIESQLLEDTDLENQIKLHAGMIQTPKFLQEKLDKEKKIVNSEINMYMSDDSANAETITLKNLFNIKSNAPTLVAGSTDNIDALTRQDVVDYFNNNYYPANTVTVITGEVDEAKTIELISKYFNSTKAPTKERTFEKMTPTEKPVRQDIISNKKTGRAEIYLGFAGPENNNEKDQVYLRAVNQLLGGLANSRLKNTEDKYSTSISLSTDRMGTRPLDKSAIMIRTSVPEEYVEPILKDIYKILTDLSVNPPTPDEFEAVKTNIKKVNSIGMQSSSELNNHIGMDFLNGTPYKTANYDKILDSMTYDDFIRTAGKYYDLNKTALTVVHPKNTTKEEIEGNYGKTKAQVSFTGTNKKTPINLDKIEQYRIPNNFEVVLIDSDSDVVNYSLDYFNKDKTPKKAAIADILNDMFKYCGTHRHSWEQLADISDKNAINSGLRAGANSINISGSFPVDKAGMSLDLFRENLLQASLNYQLFQNALKHCKDKYSTAEPSAFDAYEKAMFEGTQNAYTYKDKLDSLKDIKYNDVLALYNEILTKSQGQIVVTAPFSKHPELKQMIFNNAGSFNFVMPKDTSLSKNHIQNTDVQVHTAETNRNQAEIVEGFKFKQNGNIKDDTCILLLNTILGMGQGSRLFNDLREKRHLAYMVDSMYETYGDSGIISLVIKTTTNNTETGEKSLDNIKKSIDGFNENIEKLKTQYVTDAELEKAKRTMKSNILAGFEMNSVKNSIISDNAATVYGVDYTNKQLEMIDQITPQDLLNTARNIFAGKPIYSVAATKEALEYNKNYLENLK